MASMAYGEPRMTIDVDIVADLTHSHVPAILAQFLAPDYYVSETAGREAGSERRMGTGASKSG